MELAVFAFCGLIALIVLVIAIRPSAATPVSDVLKSLATVLASITPWAGRQR
ncbi:MAG TPA: hypothetical protein VFU36_14600 [Jatrophihabitans sp.]|nr:hypothetical protein [Jatrophihabitans sp.]